MKTKNLKKVIVFLAVISIFSGCSNKAGEETKIEKSATTFTDSRDGKTYATFVAGNKVWLGENLAFQSDTLGSWYMGNSVKYKENGCYYTWEEAQKACPEGWRLPTKDEWIEMVGAFTGYIYTGIELPSIVNIKHGGYINAKGNSHHMGKDAYFWTSDVYREGVASKYIVFDNLQKKMQTIHLHNSVKMNIRCVKDTAIEFKRPDNPYSVDEEVEKIVKTILETPVEPLEFPNNHPDAQWLPKSLGLFMHWGIHSVDGAQPSWTMLKNSPWGMSDSLRGDDYYSVLAPKFNPVNYDPDKWCAAAKKAGFDYMVLTTKHHDGYALWPSKYGSMNTRVYMNGRDLIKEYVDACRKNGLRVGFYFSPRDWHYPNCPMRKFNYNFIDYIDYEVNEWIFPYSSRIEAEIYWKEFYKYTIGQLNELLTQYGKIDMLWFDGQEAIVDDYKFDETINWIRSLQPGILINDRWYLAANGCKADFSTAEGRYPKTKPQGLWEFCNHGAKHWGYCKEDPIGTFENFINYYEKTMKDNGAYLFNVGPAPDGTMPPEYYDFCIQLEEYYSK